jgi:hypothetical protein
MINRTTVARLWAPVSGPPADSRRWCRTKGLPMKSRLLTVFLPLVFAFSAAIASPVQAGQEQQQGAASLLDQAAGERYGDHSGDSLRPPTANSTPFARTELYFGTNRADGLGPVSDEEFRGFLDQEITPRFPDGLTLMSALGQFRNAEGVIVQERSLVLILLYPADDQKASSRKIERIRTAYKRIFQQESVLRVDDPRLVWASF